jgi:FkbM family methyltransferase
MNLAKRLICGLREAFIWDNPYELILDFHILRRRNPIRLCKDGAQLIVDYRSSDMNAVHDIFINGMYDMALKSAASQFKRGGCLRYLNLGANIGAFDVRAWQFAKSNGLDIAGAALEMNTATFARLVINLEINKLLHILPINAALAAEDGQMRCELAARDTGQSAVGLHTLPQPTVQMVATMSWDTLWGKVAGPFELVKVDIEGAEAVWLEQLTQSQAQLLEYVVIETHSLDLHSLCDRNLPALGFELLQKDSSGESTRVSLWKQKNPAQELPFKSGH